MSKILFLGVPSDGHINPTLALVRELVKKGEEVIYFSSAFFQAKIEDTGATHRAYSDDLKIFSGDDSYEAKHQLIRSAPAVIADIVQQAREFQFDYIIHSERFPYTKIIAAVLKLPTVASIASFAGIHQFQHQVDAPEQMVFPGSEIIKKTYKMISRILEYMYDISMPRAMTDLLFNTGEINLVYSSAYFTPDREFFDESYQFIGPPVAVNPADPGLPVENPDGRKLIYVSLGTDFGSVDRGLYETIYKSLAGTDALVVLATGKAEPGPVAIPANFIILNDQPQSVILNHADVAITHAGMTNLAEMVSHQVPFVIIPSGTEPSELAEHAVRLGAAISLDAEKLATGELLDALERVQKDPSYLANIRKIDDSFKTAGGTKKAVAEIFAWKRRKGIRQELVH